MSEQLSMIVKFDNHFNKLELGKLKAVELDLFLTICSYVKEHGEDEVKLSFNSIKKMSKYTATQKSKFIDELVQTNEKLLGLRINISNEEDSRIIQFVLFPTFEIDKKEETLTVAVNNKFTYLLNNLTKNFTRFELKEYVEMKSKYSKILYQLLKQYRKTGALIMDVEEFRKTLDIPSGYRMSEIDKRVLTPALKELDNYFTNLTVKKFKDPKKQNAVTQIHFYFQKEDEIKKQNKAIEENDELSERELREITEMDEPELTPHEERIQMFYKKVLPFCSNEQIEEIVGLAFDKLNVELLSRHSLEEKDLVVYDYISSQVRYTKTRCKKTNGENSFYNYLVGAVRDNWADWIDQGKIY